MSVKFYQCQHCGNLVGMIHDSGVPMMCCGEKMTGLEPNTTDAAGEKHLPVAKTEGDTLVVNVGSVDHPMEEKHYIQWIYVELEDGGMRRILQPGGAPQAKFALGGSKPVAVYAYCNLHGLWMTKL
ncbi:MAG: desulfoferrodoxin family protein [Anaerovoracaceae bacterium]|jgi:superoxide reductase